MTPHAAVHADSPADLVFIGGRVLSLDPVETVSTALAVSHSRIAAIGSDADILAVAAPNATVIELAGRTLLPGINDSHLHGAWTGALWPATIMSAAGMQGDPHRQLLSSRDDKRNAILAVGKILSALGITSYTEPGIGPGEDGGSTGCFDSEVLAEYRSLAGAGLLQHRVTALLLFGILDGASELEAYERNLNLATWDSPDAATFTIAGVKIFADGIPPMRSAWTHHHYPDGTSGGLLVEGTGAIERERNLRTMIGLGHSRGLQVGVHATGDRSIEVVVDAVAELQARDTTPRDLRHYIIHGDMATPSSLHRMATSGMGINMQAGLSVATKAMMEHALDSELVVSAWPIAQSLAAGIPLCLSSDSPVLTPDWRLGLAAAANWVNGALGDDQTTMTTLLRCYTAHAAWQDGAESWKGTLEVGKVADLCVLGADLHDVAPRDVPDVDIDLTVLGGTIVYDRSGE